MYKMRETYGGTGSHQMRTGGPRVVHPLGLSAKVDGHCIMQLLDSVAPDGASGDWECLGRCADIIRITWFCTIPILPDRHHKESMQDQGAPDM